METPGGQVVQETGIDALVLMLRFHELAVDPAQIRHRYANVPFGISEILRCAKELKLKARSVVADWDRLAKTALPALAECRDGGFLMLAKIVGDKALIQDPRVGRPQLVTRAELEARWSGRLVLITRKVFPQRELKFLTVGAQGREVRAL